MSLLLLVGETQVLPILEKFGLPVLIILWFMWRTEKKLDNLTASLTNTVGGKLDNLAHKISGMTKAMLMDVISRENTTDIVKRTAHDMLSKMSGGPDTSPPI